MALAALDGVTPWQTTPNSASCPAAMLPTGKGGQRSRLSRGQSDSSTRSAQPSAVFSANASEPRQEPDTRSHRACVRSAAERAGRNDWHRAGARQNRLAEPGLQHSPPGDAGTARRGTAEAGRTRRSTGQVTKLGAILRRRAARHVSKALPEVPTVGDFVPGFEATALQRIGAPKGAARGDRRQAEQGNQWGPRRSEAESAVC